MEEESRTARTFTLRAWRMLCWRGLVLTLALAVLSLQVVAGTAAAVGASAEIEAPVVLIHGMTARGPAVWGERAATGRGLYARLLRAGYIPGRTLFTYDYGDAVGLDYTALARLGLAPVVRRAGAGGYERIDLVTFGSGALIARYWVAGRPAGYTPALRNLVMIAPPNHGQFQVDLLKTYYHTDRLVSVGTGVADVGLPVAAGAAADEDTYVAARAPFYERLYSDYLVESRFLGPAPESPPRWEEWLGTAEAEVIDERVFGAEAPVTAPGGAAATSDGLTSAYCEILSIRTGRLLYLAHAVRPGRLPPLPSLDDLAGAGLRDTVLDYLKDLILDWGLAKGEVLWKRERSGAALRLGELLSGLGAGTAAFDRLVPEHVAFPRPGTGGLGLVLANWFLQDWQAREAQARPADSRYFTVAGSVPNLLSLSGLDLGDNDLVVEVSSTLTRPAPADTFHRRSGLLSFHRALATDGQVGALVMKALGRCPGQAVTPATEPAVEPAQGATTEGTGLASLWEPTYCRLGSGHLAAGDPGAGRLEVTVRVADPSTAGSPGLVAQAWLAGVPGAPGAVPRPVAFFELAPEGDGLLSGSLTLDAGAAAGLLGVRLIPDPGAGPAYLVMTRQLGRETRIPFSYSVTHTAGDQWAETPSLPIAPLAPAAPSDEPGGEPPATTGSPAGSTDEPPAEPVEETSAETGDLGHGVEPQTDRPIEVVPTPDPPPLVNVILVTKMTTTRPEKRVYHARWDWDFGDGEQHSDDDPSHTTVTASHTYRVPGTYTARAVSTANDGRLLRDLSFTVEALADETITFTAETIVEPTVDITLEGPLKWVTGRPARFVVRAEVSWPPHTRRQVIQAYPGWQFDVVWEKPGTFEVRAAVTVRQSYEFPERRLTVVNTYIKVISIEIFIPGLTE